MAKVAIDIKSVSSWEVSTDQVYPIIMEASEESDQSSLKTSTKYPYHPQNRPKIANVAAINDFRFENGHLQFKVTEDANSWRWLNSTDFYAPEKVDAFWRQLALKCEIPKPKPFAEFVNEAHNDYKVYTPKTIVAQLSHKQNHSSVYLVENEEGKQSVINKEKMHEEYPDLVKKFFDHWVPIGGYDSASAKKTLSETVREVQTRASEIEKLCNSNNKWKFL